MIPCDDERCWTAVRDRDPAADGRFVYAVRSTGVYCRPSCPSRPARRANVAFYATPAAAAAAGFRPCKRCRPDRDGDTDAMAALRRACELIESAEAEPDLAVLANATGYSRSHFQRLFKARVGLSPKQYAIARRKARLRNVLPEAESVTDAIYAAGFGASSRGYAATDALGMAPGAYRNGAAGETIRYASATSSLGAVVVAATERGVCMVEFGAREDLVAALTRRFPQAKIVPAPHGMAELVDRVVAMIDAPAAGSELPLDIRGTAFQERVWRALTRVPPGETVSYAQLAERIGQPDAARAVARACANNGIAVAVPCHRVVRGSGELAGYKWGTERKRALLAREGAEIADTADQDVADESGD